MAATGSVRMHAGVRRWLAAAVAAVAKSTRSSEEAVLLRLARSCCEHPAVVDARWAERHWKARLEAAQRESGGEVRAGCSAAAAVRADLRLWYSSISVPQGCDTIAAQALSPRDSIRTELGSRRRESAATKLQNLRRARDSTSRPTAKRQARRDAAEVMRLEQMAGEMSTRQVRAVGVTVAGRRGDAGTSTALAECGEMSTSQTELAASTSVLRESAEAAAATRRRRSQITPAPAGGGCGWRTTWDGGAGSRRARWGHGVAMDGETLGGERWHVWCDACQDRTAAGRCVGCAGWLCLRCDSICGACESAGRGVARAHARAETLTTLDGAVERAGEARAALLRAVQRKCGCGRMAHWTCSCGAHRCWAADRLECSRDCATACLARDDTEEARAVRAELRRWTQEAAQLTGGGSISGMMPRAWGASLSGGASAPFESLGIEERDAGTGWGRYLEAGGRRRCAGELRKLLTTAQWQALAAGPTRAGTVRRLRDLGGDVNKLPTVDRALMTFTGSTHENMVFVGAHPLFPRDGVVWMSIEEMANAQKSVRLRSLATLGSINEAWQAGAQSIQGDVGEAAWRWCQRAAGAWLRRRGAGREGRTPLRVTSVGAGRTDTLFEAGQRVFGESTRLVEAFDLCKKRRASLSELYPSTRVAADGLSAEAAFEARPCDALTITLECNSCSRARRGLEGEQRRLRMRRTIRRIWMAVAGRCAAASHISRIPAMLVVENVAGLAQLEGGVALRLLLGALVHLPFRLAFQVIDAERHCDAGQSRSRVIIVGVRRDVAEEGE